MKRFIFLLAMFVGLSANAKVVGIIDDVGCKYKEDYTRNSRIYSYRATHSQQTHTTEDTETYEAISFEIWLQLKKPSYNSDGDQDMEAFNFEDIQDSVGFVRSFVTEGKKGREKTKPTILFNGVECAVNGRVRGQVAGQDRWHMRNRRNCNFGVTSENLGKWIDSEGRLTRRDFCQHTVHLIVGE